MWFNKLLTGDATAAQLYESFFKTSYTCEFVEDTRFDEVNSVARQQMTSRADTAFESGTLFHSL